jgi:phosphatidate cytidylyltransferase
MAESAEAEPGTSGTEPAAPGTEPRTAGTEQRTPGAEKRAPGTEPRAPGAEPGAPGTGTGGKHTISTGRNLPIAVAVGTGMGALVLLSLFTVKSTFLIYMGAAICLAGWELNRALGTAGIRLPVVPLAVSGAALWASAYWIGPRAALPALGLGAVVMLAWRLPGGAAGYVRDVTASVFTLAYLPLLSTFVVLMLVPGDGPRRVLLFIALTVCNDVGGYFAGILIGRHPLAPRISPKKTWEGLAGSAIVCVGAGMGLLPWLLHGHLWQGAIVGVAAVAASTLGDLAESQIKRDLDIKDMGTVLPGHGGIFDRLDSLLVNAPVIWLLLTIFIPVGVR